uniref:Uncharacterized protein n=1 Tax=Cacopsylla melanoneura TaxID=428564 RepID=A0A8D9BJ25_9HEMI
MPFKRSLTAAVISQQLSAGCFNRMICLIKNSTLSKDPFLFSGPLVNSHRYPILPPKIQFLDFFLTVSHVSFFTLIKTHVSKNVSNCQNFTQLSTFLFFFCSFLLFLLACFLF